ncbi:hypothetical protein HNR46_003940 [Haloferula luteola]|uniref:Uncharacterized protein n=1 Tax=Haloferula luteola TaxID=595692 RepID=A0A840VIR6_9BACT|nr:hypothetical protein [Haloferula luteola]MBB5353679.1 hypothetical protein [Haloferula luteola]
MTLLPKSLLEAVAQQIEEARAWWSRDREAGLAGVWMPNALSRKYRCGEESFEWFWLFPASKTAVDPATVGSAEAPEGIRRRHHLTMAFTTARSNAGHRGSGLGVVSPLNALVT